MSLDKVKIGLERRNAEAEVFTALVQHMMHDTPKGSIKTFTLGDKQYELTLKPKEPTQ